MPTPKTVLLDAPPGTDRAHAAAVELLAAWGPVVAKPRALLGGAGGTLCRTVEALTAAHAAGATLVQRVVPAAFGRDRRVVVIDGEVVQHIIRQARPGEFRSNVALGAEIIPADPHPAVEALARAASTSSRPRIRPSRSPCAR